MASIDLNSDLGENVPDRIVSDDESMLRLVTSANVACGYISRAFHIDLQDFFFIRMNLQSQLLQV